MTPCQFYCARLWLRWVSVCAVIAVAGSRPVLNICLLSLSHISVLHKRRRYEFIAQDSRSLLTVTTSSQWSTFVQCLYEPERLQVWHRDPDFAACWDEKKKIKSRLSWVLLTCLFSVSVPSWPCRQVTSLLCVLCNTRRTSSIRLSICTWRKKV